ncbi:hypothetical protein GGX14DRAFT_570775 [Mycena pura]|uniref:T6SS Phospholipase effector Tle1-like catalytic domain-containing protein n=1 Tax=Mycena pura TaxID=153505 RepID=A0AAD6V4I6_9AGAR|nr:hypothetical protein GGX14DRAFT_570775 [Mycena pura]
MLGYMPRELGQFGTNNTNVVELHSRIMKDCDNSHPQLTFYSSGIGTYVPPSLRSFAYWRQLLANKIDLAIAWNFKKQVQDAYRWLADNYKPGDVIFLFGFSRGAYQVRTLAGMITTVGLVYSGNPRLIPFAYELYANRLKGKAIEDHKEASELCKHFKQTFSRPNVKVHFVGAWDTVSSVGIFRGQPLPLTTSADHICHFRHALALDERRVRFLPEYVHSTPPKVTEDHEDLEKRSASSQEPKRTSKEVWFAGTHSDIGGGNRKNISLDLGGVPLLWMENEATSAGLHLHPRNDVWKWEDIKREKPFESLTGPFWWFLEKIPLARSTYNVDKLDETISWPPHQGKGRLIVKDQLIHASVAFKYDIYRPRARFSGFEFERQSWDTLVGKGTVNDIKWAQDWRERLEMDIFDPSLAGDTAKNFIDATTDEEIWNHLKMIPFLALSDNAVSSLVEARVLDKLIEILKGSEESGVKAEWQAASSTSLRLMIKSGRLQVGEATADTILNRLDALLRSARASSKDQIAHLMLLDELNPPASSVTWTTAQEAILGLVRNAQENDPPIEKSRGNKQREHSDTRTGGGLAGSADASGTDAVDLDAVARYLADFTRRFCHIFNEQYGHAIPKLLQLSPCAALECIDSLSINRKFDGIIEQNMLTIVDLLQHKEGDVRLASVGTVGNLAKHPAFRVQSNAIKESIGNSVPRIVKLFKDADTETRLASIRTMDKVVQEGKITAIKQFVPRITEMLKDDDPRVTRTAVTVFSNLAKKGEASDSPSDDFFGETEVIRSRISRLNRCFYAPDHHVVEGRVIDLLREKDKDVRSAAAEAVGAFAKHAVFHGSINGSIPRILALLEDGAWEVRKASVRTMINLSEHDTFMDPMLNIVPLVMDLIQDKHNVVRAEAACAVWTLAKHVAFQDTILGSMPQIVELLKDTDLEVQMQSIHALTKLAEEGTEVYFCADWHLHPIYPDVFREALVNTIPELKELLNGRSGYLRSVAAAAVGDLATYTVFHRSIEPFVSQITELLQDSEWTVKSASIYTIIKIAEEDAFRDSLTSILSGLPNGHDYGPSVTVATVCDLVMKTAFRGSVKSSVPRIAELLKDSLWQVRMTSIRTFVKLAEQGTELIYFRLHGADIILRLDTFRDSLTSFIPQLMELLKDKNAEVRSVAAAALGDLARHSKVSPGPFLSTRLKFFKALFHSTVEASMPILAELLKDSKAVVRSTNAFHESMIDVVLQAMDLLKDRAYDVRSAATTLVGDLAKYIVFHDCLEVAVPRVVGLLKDNSFHDAVEGVQPQITEFLRDELGHVDTEDYRDALKAAETLLHKLKSSGTAPTPVRIS